MLVIRLRRTGKKGQPSYRIVVADQRKSVYAPYVEMLGHYNPETKAIVLNKEKALEWMKKGAKPSNTVAKLLQKQDLKHPSIVIKKFRAVSKAELEAQKAKEEAEKAKIAAEKEAQKAAFEERVEAEKAAQPSSEEKLQAAAEGAIEETKTEEKVEEKTEEKTQAPAEPAEVKSQKVSEEKPAPDKEKSK